MKKAAVAILLLLVASLVFADAYTIGTGTSTASAYPFNGLWDYSWSKTIYNQTEINDAGLSTPASFSGIGFYVGNTPANFTMVDQRVYARHTAMEMYDTADVEHPNFEDFQLLFQGDLTYNGGGWYYIVFSSPFAWDGSQNIEFLFENWDGEYITGYPTFRYTSTTPNYLAVSKNQDNTFPAGINGARSYNRPNIQLVTPTTTPPDPAVLAGPANGATYAPLQPTLSWGPGNVWPDGYRLSLGTDNPPTNILDAEDLENAVTYQHPTAFGYETTIYWQVVPYNGYGNASDCPVWSFTTHPDGFVTVGEGNQNALMPLNFYYKGSIYECLYYPDELGFVSGTITAIKLYNQFNSNIVDTPIKIWLGSTTQPDLSGGYIPASQLSLVFDGTLNLPSGANDILIELDSPYTHTPGNLVMMALRPLDSAYYSASDFFKCQTVGNNRARNAYSDSVVYDPLNPPAGTLTGQFPKTSFIYQSESITNDLACMGISGETVITAGEEATYTVQIKNNGSATQSSYQVKLMQVDGGELVSIAGPAIESLETLEVELNWTPTVAGEYSLYAEVVMAGDEIDTNNQSQILNIIVLPEGLMSVTIGDGDQNARFPVDFYWKNSLFETIYYPDELGFVSGTISTVQFYNNFSSNIVNTPIKIWMGSTNLPDLSDGYIPSTALNLVFDGNMDFPSGQNEVLVNLTTPYSHTPGNLVMLVERPMDTSYYSSSDYFKCQTVGNNRARNASSDSANYDPAAPPAGTLTGQFPKTTFFYTGETIENDLGCLAITGSITPSVGMAYPYTITIKNNGSATQNNYQVKLMREGDVELASINGTSIESAETLEFTLDWTPTETGETYLYGKVVLAGDEIDSNNESAHLNVMVYPEGTLMVTIGEGGSTGRMPLDFYYKSSIFETMYLASEIGLEGSISGIQFYSNFTNAIEDKPVRFWLGETTQTDLSAGWIPSTQLSLVFDGTMDIPAGQNEVYVELPTPYAYGGGNLVLMAHRPLDTEYFSGSNFVTQTGTIAARTRNLFSDSAVYDPTDPPTATPSAIFPKTTLVFSDGEEPEDIIPPTQLTATAVNNSYVALDWLAPGDTPPPPPPTEIDEGFESYPDFALTFDPWVLVDVDGSGTYGVQGYSWPNVYSAMAYMIFNPSATTPPLASLEAHSGSKMAASFASTQNANNDWMISPAFTPAAGQFLNFYARSYVSDYGLERFKVGVSNGGTAPANFTIISGANYIQAPINWTLYSYDLSSYAGQEIRFGIQCLSDDAFFFLVDDITVGTPPSAKTVIASTVPTEVGRSTGTPVPAPRTATRELEGYNVYRDGALLSFVPGAGVTSYEDHSVTVGTYSYTVTAVYTSGESTPAGPASATIHPPNQPPVNLTADVEGSDVTLNWESPEAPQQGEWITWCNETTLGNAIGTNGVVTFDVAHRFTQSDLTAHQGKLITQVQFAPHHAACVYTIKVWTGGSASNAGTLVSSQVVESPVMDEWNLAVLNTPVPVPSTGDLYVGYECNTQGGYPAGCDAGPQIEGKGNMMYIDGSWATLTQLAPSLTYNWMIKTFVAETNGMKAVELSPIAEHETISYSKAPLAFSAKTAEQAEAKTDERLVAGFKVYRDGTLIATLNDPSAAQYTDYGVPNGTYIYGVTAVHTTGESEPAQIEVTVDLQLAEIVFEDDFESYDNFTLQFAPWTLLDVDLSETYSIQNVDFPNAGAPMAYMIFNPSATVPAVTGIQAHSGSKMAASFAAVNGPNNDWLITPRIQMGTDSSVRFYARSHTAQYGMERFRVGVSMLPNVIPQGFQYVSPGNYVEAPAGWMEYIYDLSAYDGQTVRIGIRCVSDDAFIFYVDDFSVHSDGGTVDIDDPGMPALVTELQGNYPNPFNPSTTIRYSVKEATPVTIGIYNVKGQLVKTLVNEDKSSGNHSVVWNGRDNNNQAVSSGVYFYKMLAGKYSSTKKMILMK